MTRSEPRILAATMAEPQFNPWQSHDPRAGTVSHNFTLDRQIATARREMGEEKWQRLQAEWGVVGGVEYV